MNYYVLGFLVGLGKKKTCRSARCMERSAQSGLLRIGRLRTASFKSDAAIDYYSKSLLLDPEDPLGHYASGLAYYRKAEITQSAATLPEARRHFETMLKLNSELAQAQTARKYIATINATLSSQ